MIALACNKQVTMLRKQALELANVSGCCHTLYMEKKTGLYEIMNGTTYWVKANSAEEAEAIWNVGMGYLDESHYPHFEIDGETAFELIEEGETDTWVEHIEDLSD